MNAGLVGFVAGIAMVAASAAMVWFDVYGDSSSAIVLGVIGVIVVAVSKRKMQGKPKF